MSTDDFGWKKWKKEKKNGIDNVYVCALLY